MKKSKKHGFFGFLASDWLKFLRPKFPDVTKKAFWNSWFDRIHRFSEEEGIKLVTDSLCLFTVGLGSRPKHLLGQYSQQPVPPR